LREITLATIDSQRRPFDSILKRGLDLQRDPGGDGCPDEATLAAYCDDSLPAAQSARCEEHFSNCARCQGTLAALARAADDSAPARMARHRWELYGAALAAALVGVSVAVTLIRNRTSPPVQFAAAHIEEFARMPASPPPPKAPEAGAQIALNEARPKTEAPAIAASGAAQSAPPEMPEASSAPFAIKGAMPGGRLEGAPATTFGSIGGAGAPPRTRFFATESSRLAAKSAAASGERESALPPAPGIAGAIASNRALAPEPAAAPMLSRGVLLQTASVRTADNVERWRLGANGMIEHLAPDGSWRRQTSGVTATLHAGAAPSPLTCWIVGADGTILRTTDGEHWQTINSPTAHDLVAISAIDASEATVTAAGGARFTTADGGRTWRPL
jgi:hypothetical protein